MSEHVGHEGLFMMGNFSLYSMFYFGVGGC
jgi:hypothetical protein